MGKFVKRSNLKVVVLSILVFSSCSNDDDSGENLVPLFPESNLSIIHGNSEKSWKITELINDFYDPNYDLEIDLGCVSDDVYTFSSATEEVTITLGDEKCFGTNDDGIFTADEEIFDAELYFSNETITLEFARGYINDEGTALGVSLRWFKLAELSEDRMVFYRESSGILGDYREAIVFERI
jgi:hypothetical protein